MTIVAGQDGVCVEYSTDRGTNWNVLGGWQATEYWVNRERVLGLHRSMLASGWSGSQGWTFTSYPLMELNGASEVYFRFRLGASATDNDW